MAHCVKPIRFRGIELFWTEFRWISLHFSRVPFCAIAYRRVVSQHLGQRRVIEAMQQTEAGFVTSLLNSAGHLIRNQPHIERNVMVS